MATPATPWTQYAQQPAQDGPWAKYSQAPAPQAPQPSGMLDKLKSGYQSDITPVPYDGLPSIIHNTMGRAEQGLVSTVAHPIDAAASMLKVGLDNGITGPANQNPLLLRGQEFTNEWNGGNKAQALENVAGDVLAAGAGSRVGDLAQPLAAKLGPVMQNAGGTLIDRAAGSLAKDFKRGAEPGLSYLQGGGTPALTMQGLATKAGTVAGKAGAAIRPTLAGSSAVIPSDAVFDAVANPVSKLRGIQNGPGGIGASPSLDAYENNLLPALQQGAQRGGYTPAQLYDELKQPIQKTTNWKDQAMFDLNKVRQNTTGALGGLIADQVPEVRSLNDIFRGASNLQERAQLRANTGSAPLSAMGRRAIEAGVGNAVLGPGGAVIAAGDSVPGLTSAGYGLFKSGGVVAPVAKGLSLFAGPAVAASVGNQKKPNQY
jgi:hypothetical protein